MAEYRNQQNENTTSIQQQQKNHEQYQEYNYNNNNNYNNTRPTVSQEILSKIRDSYSENVAPQMTRAAARMIEDAMSHGMDPDTVILAIEETGLAPHPSPLYLRAILRHWAMTGVTVSRAHSLTQPNKARPWWKVSEADKRWSSGYSWTPYDEADDAWW